jgi:hypothetical protein
VKKNSWWGLAIGLAMVLALIVGIGRLLSGPTAATAEAVPSRILISGGRCPSHLTWPRWISAPSVVRVQDFNDLTGLSWPEYVKSPTVTAQIWSQDGWTFGVVGEPIGSHGALLAQDAFYHHGPLGGNGTVVWSKTPSTPWIVEAAWSDRSPCRSLHLRLAPNQAPVLRAVIQAWARTGATAFTCRGQQAGVVCVPAS